MSMLVSLAKNSYATLIVLVHTHTHRAPLISIWLLTKCVQCSRKGVVKPVLLHYTQMSGCMSARLLIKHLCHASVGRYLTTRCTKYEQDTVNELSSFQSICSISELKIVFLFGTASYQIIWQCTVIATAAGYYMTWHLLCVVILNLIVNMKCRLSMWENQKSTFIL